MHESDEQLLTIGQLARRVDMPTSTLRYYESQHLLMPVERTEAGYRLYDRDAEHTLQFIRRTQRLGFTLSDIRALLVAWREGELNDDTVLRTAEERYLALERQVTPLLVLQHEMSLFLQDMQQRLAQSTDRSSEALLARLVDRVCANPLNRPAEKMLDWFLEYTGCVLTTAEGRAILARLRIEHVHIWQEHDAYHILVVSDDPAVGEALEALTNLEASCQAHTHSDQAPEFAHDGEGFLLIAHGANAFVFARLFLALEAER